MARRRAGLLLLPLLLLFLFLLAVRAGAAGTAPAGALGRRGQQEGKQRGDGFRQSSREEFGRRPPQLRRQRRRLPGTVHEEQDVEWTQGQAAHNPDSVVEDEQRHVQETGWWATMWQQKQQPQAEQQQQQHKKRQRGLLQHSGSRGPGFRAAPAGAQQSSQAAAGDESADADGSAVFMHQGDSATKLSAHTHLRETAADVEKAISLHSFAEGKLTRVLDRCLAHRERMENCTATAAAAAAATAGAHGASSSYWASVINSGSRESTLESADISRLELGMILLGRTLNDTRVDIRHLMGDFERAENQIEGLQRVEAAHEIIETILRKRADVDYESGRMQVGKDRDRLDKLFANVSRWSQSEIEELMSQADPAVFHVDMDLLSGFVLLTIVSAIAGIIATALNVPPSLGYIVGGMIVGPSGLGLVGKVTEIQTLAQFGSIFLLFSHGLSYSGGASTVPQPHTTSGSAASSPRVAGASSSSCGGPSAIGSSSSSATGSSSSSSAASSSSMAGSTSGMHPGSGPTGSGTSSSTSASSASPSSSPVSSASAGATTSGGDMRGRGSMASTAASLGARELERRRSSGEEALGRESFTLVPAIITVGAAVLLYATFRTLSLLGGPSSCLVLAVAMSLANTTDGAELISRAKLHNTQLGNILMDTFRLHDWAMGLSLALPSILAHVFLQPSTALASRFVVMEMIGLFAVHILARYLGPLLLLRASNMADGPGIDATSAMAPSPSSSMRNGNDELTGGAGAGFGADMDTDFGVGLLAEDDAGGGVHDSNAGVNGRGMRMDGNSMGMGMGMGMGVGASLSARGAMGRKGYGHSHGDGDASSETVLLGVAGYCTGIAVVTERLELSYEVGAFFAGIALQDRFVVERIRPLIRPIVALFGAMYLASIGMVLSAAFFLEHILLILLHVVVLTAVKFICTFFTLHNLLGVSEAAASRAALSLSTISDTAFFASSRARQLNLVSRHNYLFTTCVVVTSACLSPLLLRTNFVAQLKSAAPDLRESRITAFLLGGNGSWSGGSSGGANKPRATVD